MKCARHGDAAAVFGSGSRSRRSSADRSVAAAEKLKLSPAGASGQSPAERAQFILALEERPRPDRLRRRRGGVARGRPGEIDKDGNPRDHSLPEYETHGNPIAPGARRSLGKFQFLMQ